MILYILALGSPTHPVPASDVELLDQHLQLATPSTADLRDLPAAVRPPVLALLDRLPRHRRRLHARPRASTYFENSRRATLAQKRYATPTRWARVGYADNLWGLTASRRRPTGYNARGAPPTQNDDGTITPTAPLSSIPFAPGLDACPWRGTCGTTTAPVRCGGRTGSATRSTCTSNPDWYDPDYIGIDQGPIVLMIENYRTGAIWKRFKRNADIHRGLERAGFLPWSAWTTRWRGQRQRRVSRLSAVNPFQRQHHGAVPPERRGDRCGSRCYDLAGREVARLVDGVRRRGRARGAVRRATVSRAASITYDSRAPAGAG